jgi:putative intracellular protease/amidase
VSIAPESRDELPRLLSALADGTLDAADEERLAELLRTDPAARASYYNHAMLAALLRREGRRAAAQRQADTPRSQFGVDAGVNRRAHAAVTSRLRPWLLVLAASVLLGLLLSVGEATGVTRLVPTLIRIVTGEGSLVIEVDDPSVSVTLDGEDITITGAGIHELRLRPGTHKFVATKDGQPLRDEVVTIERGGKRVVSVSREATNIAGGGNLRGQTSSRNFPGQFTIDGLRRRRVLIILPARDFYYPDYIPVRDTLIRAGVQVLIAAPTPDAAQPMPGNPGHVPVAPDLVLASIDGASYDAIYFCGGTGVEEFIGSSPYAADARRVIAEALAAKKFVTALSTGPLVLADAGVLSGVRATCYPFDDGVYIERLKSAGAIWVDEPAVVSGLIITGCHPGTTREFSEALLQQLGVRSAAGQK